MDTKNNNKAVIYGLISFFYRIDHLLFFRYYLDRGKHPYLNKTE